MALVREKEKWEGKGFVGGAHTSKNPPYSQKERSHDMYPLGKESNFIIPESAEKRAQSPKGMKR